MILCLASFLSPTAPKQPGGSIDCGAYFTLFARTLYDAHDDMT